MKKNYALEECEEIFMVYYEVKNAGFKTLKYKVITILFFK